MYKIKDIAKILNVSDRTVEKSIESHNRQMELILLSITNKKFIEE
jgi:transcriptional antiterminator